MIRGTGDAERGPGQVRVLRVIARLNVGGPARHVALLNAGMDRDPRFRSWLVTGTENPSEGTLLQYAQDHGVEPLVIPEIVGHASFAPRDLVALAKLTALTRRIRPHVMHTHTAKAGFLGRLAARAAGVPVVLHTYHGHVLSGYYSWAKTRALQAMERGLARMSDQLIAVSDRVRDDLVQMGVAPVERFRVVPLGLDLAPLFDIAAHRGVLRRELDVAPTAPLVGIVGRLFPIKNHALFLDAAARVLVERPDARFVIVGDGTLRGDLEARAQASDLVGRVFFTGWRHDLATIYADLDVLAVSSRNEGTPVSAIEAMAAGCPVVATRVGGLPDLIADGHTGLLVPPDDPVALASAIGHTLMDADGTRSLRAAARADVEKRFMATRLVADMQDLYLHLLTAKGVAWGAAAGEEV
ncbi:MAG: glycosyltransferase [Acidobacteria bacterium]|nr:glycosyltransferase [Acidobacteriota bacterium]